MRSPRTIRRWAEYGERKHGEKRSELSAQLRDDFQYVIATRREGSEWHWAVMLRNGWMERNDNIAGRVYDPSIRWTVSAPSQTGTANTEANAIHAAKQARSDIEARVSSKPWSIQEGA